MRLKSTLLICVFLFELQQGTANAQNSELEKSMAQNIASLDYITLNCSDRMQIDGKFFIMLNAIWRGLLIRSEGSLLDEYDKEFAAVEKDMKAAEAENKDSCLIMFLWFRAMLPKTSPVVQMK